MESYCAIPCPPPVLQGALEPFVLGLNPAPATIVFIPLQFLFSNFSLKSEKKILPALCMDAFEFEHVIACIVKADLGVLISEDVLALRQFLPHELFWLLHV